MKTLPLIIFFFLSSTVQLSAQSDVKSDTAKWVTLQEVEVNALSLPTSKLAYPGMVGTISNEKIGISDPTISNQLFNRIPGVYWHSGAVNTNRITIRGIGSRSPFSTNKIRAYYEDIPLTDGGGETAIEDIDLQFVGNVEVHKGPNSSAFGSGLGGTIFFKQKGVTENRALINTTVGSYGLFRFGAYTSLKKENKEFQIGYQSQTSDGYRDNNTLDKHTIYGASSIALKNGHLSFIGLFLTQKAFIPSSLGVTAFENEPRSAAANWNGARGFEDYDRWLTGISWELNFSNIKLITSAYSTGRKGYEPRPFNILRDQNSGAGLRLRLEGIGEKWSWSAGLEGFADSYEAQIFENLLPSDGSEQGNLLSSAKQPRKYVNVFGQTRYQITERTELSGGINVNQTTYRLETSFPSTSTSEKKFDLIVSPRLSLTQVFGDSFTGYATISHGFSPPSIDDSLNPDGSLSLGIRPEIGWNKEIGWKYDQQKMNVEIALFSMSVKDLLVTRRTAEDVVFGVNAGKTLHRGVEIDGAYLLVDQLGKLIVDFSYGYSDFSFEDFIDDGDDFSGNQLTGVPQNQLSIGLSHTLGSYFSTLDYQFIDRIPITDDNATFSKSYQLLSASVGVRRTFSEVWKWDAVIRLNNILDEEYASMLSINANGFWRK